MGTYITKTAINVKVSRRCGLFLLCLLVLPGLSTAQAPDPEVSADTPEVAYLDPAIPLPELAHRLIPLTKGELEPVALAWLEIVKTKTEVIAERQVELLQDPSSATDEARQSLAKMVEERAGLLQRFSDVVDALQSKGGDEALVAELRAYRTSVLTSETALARPEAIAKAFLAWLTRADGGGVVAKNIGVVIMVLFVLVLVSRVIRAILRRRMGRIESLSKLLQNFLVGTVYWLVLAVGLLLALAVLGVNVTPLFAMIGGVSFILAFALQDTLGNFASGLMIMFNSPFDEGDYVLIGGQSGTVKSVSIMATTISTPDNQVIVIPNKSVWGNVITNVTASDTRRVDLVFGISYDDSIPDAMRVIEETVKAHPLVLADPEPVVRVHELAASSVNFICRPWTKTSDYWAVYWDLTHSMKENLEAASIRIPYPQQDVHIRTQEA